MARIAYLGTPAMAVPPLLALVGAGHEVVLVVTRPDRRRGRGSAVSPSPVKEAATSLGLPVTERLDDVVDAGAELGVVVAYGRIVPERVLERVPMVNMHFSLLPRWRGAAPVERAILAGDEVSGVCLMALERELDTGPVYVCEEVPIGGDDLATLRGRLVEVGCRLVVPLLRDGLAGLPVPVPQQGVPVYADKVDPSELHLCWDLPAAQLARVVRLGRAWAEFRGRRLRVLEAEVLDRADGLGSLPGARTAPGEEPPGTIRDGAVRAAQGWLLLRVVQPEGRRAMEAREWLRGARPAPGEQLT